MIAAYVWTAVSLLALGWSGLVFVAGAVGAGYWCWRGARWLGRCFQ